MALSADRLAELDKILGEFEGAEVSGAPLRLSSLQELADTHGIRLNKTYGGKWNRGKGVDNEECYKSRPC
jgi:hypothetical protein